jgi:uncharacterized protein
LTARSPKRLSIEGPAGSIELAVADPGDRRRGYAVIAHPHPLYGGTLDNKVVQTLSKAFLALGHATVRFNFRGVGGSEGVFDDGRGETEDLLAVARYAKSQYGEAPLLRLVLVAPAVGRFPVDPVAEGTLVVHGEQDDVVALADVFEWARPQQLPVVVFPGTGHFFHGMLVPLQQLVMNHCRD